jgi:predicted signal transduction protein with EAL and GGDEF domain
LTYEALARWESPVLGAVAPTDFIAAAERTGLINRLTEVLFAKALAALKTWPAHLSLSFNLSACDISSWESIERIGRMVEESGFAPRRIYFEITETALIQDFAQATERLSYLRKLGARISLDDFGTGYSSLNYIHRIPLDKVKVDKSFVAGLTKDQASRDIVRSIVELCRNLKLPCIIEGVETIEQVIILRSIGCVIMQGFYFGRPVLNEDVLHEIASARDIPPVPCENLVSVAFDSMVI